MTRNTDTNNSIELDEERDSFQLGDIGHAVVFSTDWTTETIISQLKQGNIHLNPKFQRRDAWTTTRKSQFIESLLLGLPIPQIVLAEKKDARGQYIVLDGKQRLLTLSQFMGISEDINTNFRLKNLDVRSDLDGTSFNELKNSFSNDDDVNFFLNQPIRAVIIRNWPNINFLHLVFIRLNTGSVALSPQELRQALFPGKFSDFIDDAASESTDLQQLLKLSNPDFRMRDIELLLRFFAFKCRIEQYEGNMKKFLDSTCEELNKEFDTKREDILAINQSFNDALRLGNQIFNGQVAKKWIGDKYENRINRAILDPILFYFSIKDVKEQLLAHASRIEDGFKLLCTSNEAFRSSVETTTKSIDATFQRFYYFGKLLHDIGIQSIKLPQLTNGRIQI